MEPATHKWTMVVDLDKCTGCSACVVACHAENNVSIYTEREVARGRGMHWMHIERYWEGEWPHIEARFLRSCASSANVHPASRCARRTPRCTASRKASTCRSITAASAPGTAKTTIRTRFAFSTSLIRCLMHP